MVELAVSCKVPNVSENPTDTPVPNVPPFKIRFELFDTKLAPCK